jgi:hypothetical protein
MKNISFLMFIFAIMVSSVFAQIAGNPENLCRNGIFPTDSEDYSIGTIKAKKRERVYFYDDSRKCPKDKNCRLRTYLVKGDEVLTSRTYGNFVCAWYQRDVDAEFVGWLPANKVEYIPILYSKYESWIGDWKFYDNGLLIERIGKTEDFDVRGTAFWKGLGDNIHYGEIQAKGTLNDDVIKLKQDDCEVKLKLIFNYLVVSDNLKCGGANVTFSGIYLKRG